MAPRNERRQEPGEAVNDPEGVPPVADHDAGATDARLGREVATLRVDGGPLTEFDPTWRGDERGEVT